MSITRRAALQALGAVTLPTLASAGRPSDAEAARFAARAADAQGSLFRADERATVSAIADAVLPRTGTPGALDVGVPVFVELIAAEWMTERERMAFREGLAALDAHAVATEGRAWPALDQAAREREASWAEGSEERELPAKVAFRRLKGLTVQGFFSSERVQKEVLRTQIIPGRYLGCAPIPAVPATGTEDPPNEVRYEHPGHEDHHDA
jgi:hypothetical protein